MSPLAQKLRRLREATCVAQYGASFADSVVLFTAYLRLLLQPPTRRERVVRLRIHATVHAFTFRDSDIFTLGEILFEHQYRLPDSLPAGSIIISAGANIGVMSRLLQATYPGSRLIVFEPAPDNVAILRRNVEGLPGVSVEECALGDSVGTAQLHFGAHEAEHSLVGSGSDGPGTTVRCDRLDAYMERHGIDRVALLKVDVEGSEAALVRGLGSRLSDVDVIVGEFHETLVREEDFYPLLARAGFEVVDRQAPFDGGPVHIFRADRRPRT